jgi:hypothetical protein
MKKLLLFVFFLFISTNIFAQQNVSFVSIKTFEAGYTAPDKGNRVYKSNFLQSESRYIWCEINLSNKLYEVRDQFCKAKWIYYNSDGTERGRTSADWNINKEWSTTWHQHGWGWDEPGNWPLGTYRIDFYLDDYFVAETSFTIIDAIYRPEISFISLKFFEGGDVPVDRDKRIYLKNFDKSNTRRIYYEIGINNLDYNKYDNPIELKAKYYRPDGTLFGEPVLNKTIPPDWETADLWHGWGWAEPGNWGPGNYKVEIYYKNILFAEGYFTINSY